MLKLIKADLTIVDTTSNIGLDGLGLGFDRFKVVV